MRALYFYLRKAALDRVLAVAPAQAAYRNGMGLGDFLGGPFGDRSGGLITFEVASVAEAERLVTRDSFVQEHLLKHRSLEQWLID